MSMDASERSLSFETPRLFKLLSVTSPRSARHSTGGHHFNIGLSHVYACLLCRSCSTVHPDERACCSSSHCNREPLRSISSLLYLVWKSLASSIEAFACHRQGAQEAEKRVWIHSSMPI